MLLLKIAALDVTLNCIISFQTILTNRRLTSAHIIKLLNANSHTVMQHLTTRFV